MWHLGCILRRQVLMARGVLLCKSYADFAALAIPANPCKKRAKHLWLAYRIWLMFSDFVMAKEYLCSVLPGICWLASFFGLEHTQRTLFLCTKKIFLILAYDIKRQKDLPAVRTRLCRSFASTPFGEDVSERIADNAFSLPEL
jgi:hypothetical protein